MASTLTTKNAAYSLRALSMGASDYIPKPSSTSELHSGVAFRHELVGKVKTLGTAFRKGQGQPLPGEANDKSENDGQEERAASPAPPKVVRKSIAFAKPATQPAKIIAIGSSTGGPQALFKVLAGLKSKLSVPVVITQHMPAKFTAILAEHIESNCGVPCKEGVDGEPIEAGRVYIAPGDFHMRLTGDRSAPQIKLSQDEPVNFCRPAVDPMFESVASIYGACTLGVVLTGMGHDGEAGGRQITEAGGSMIAQDEATSVVWGMPGAVANAGICSAVLPITEIAGRIAKLVGRGG